jgi:hypothetical protein
MDFAKKMEAMREIRETTPPVASTHGAKDARAAAVSQRMRAVATGRKAVLADGAKGMSPYQARVSERMSAVSRGIKAPKA